MDSDAPRRSNCSKSAGKPVTTLLELAKAAGRGTGVVTTTRVTRHPGRHLCPPLQPGSGSRHRRPAGARRRRLQQRPQRGGGRGAWRWQQLFLPKADKGKREDGRNLISEMQAKGYQFASNLDELNKAQAGKPLLGLFGSSHMKYDLDRPASEPSLPDDPGCHQAAQRPETGLLPDGGRGRIDHALHDTNAKRACRTPSPSTTPSRRPSTR